MKFTKIPETAFQNLQINAGILLRNFDPETAETENSDIIGATSGGVSFSATPTYSDYGADIDNAPRNTKELKRLDNWDVSMSGTFITVDENMVKTLISAADVSGNKVTPRNDLEDDDFEDIWWVGDYSDNNDESDGGFVAIHMLNSLSTGGFSMQSNDRGKGTFSFTFTGHYSIADQTKVPFEVFVKQGGQI